MSMRREDFQDGRGEGDHLKQGNRQEDGKKNGEKSRDSRGWMIGRSVRSSLEKMNDEEKRGRSCENENRRFVNTPEMKREEEKNPRNTPEDSFFLEQDVNLQGRWEFRSLVG